MKRASRPTRIIWKRRINLGRLLHMAGRLAEAERVYRDTEAEPFLAFNFAVLLEDLDRESDAILTYREALATGSAAGRCALQSCASLRARA